MMASRKVDLRETVGMVLCALLSLAAFLILLAYSDRLPAILGLAVSLVCPIVYLIILLWSDGSGGSLIQWVKHRAVLRRPVSRWGGQPAGVPVEG